MTRRGALVIAAHANTESGLLGRLSGLPRAAMWRHEDLAAVAISPGVSLAPADQTVLDNLSPDYRRAHPLAVIHADDICHPARLSTDGATTWVKMSVSSLASLRVALRTPVTRIRTTDPTSVAHPSIKEIRWQGGFLGDLRLPLSESLTALIGGRGTGKSTLVESLRYVLDLPPFKPARGVGEFVRWQTIDVSVPLRLPRLEDTHVVLRAFVDGDAHLIQDVSTDPFIPLITSVPDVPDIEAARAFLHRQQARLDDHAGYSLAIADSASNEALGQIGLWLPDLMQGRVSIGYWVAARHRGRGIAKHALALISTWGLGLPGVHRLELYVEPWNQASWRTAERVGYQREGLLRSWQTVGQERRDMYMYSLLPRDRP